jgi:hypothetical protein
VTPFALSLTPERIAEAARTLTDKEASDAGSIEAHNKEEKR